MSTVTTSSTSNVKPKRKLVKLVKPVYDDKRKDDTAYAVEFEESMAAYNKRLAKRDKERIKRKEQAAKLTPEMKKLIATRDYARDYLKHTATATHLDKAIHMIILVKDTVPDGLDEPATIKLADSIAEEYGRKPDESIKEREARIRKSMERAKQVAATKASTSSQ